MNEIGQRGEFGMKSLENFSTRQLEFWLSDLERRWEMAVALSRKNRIESQLAEIEAILGKRKRNSS